MQGLASPRAARLPPYRRGPRRRQLTPRARAAKRGSAFLGTHRDGAAGPRVTDHDSRITDPRKSIRRYGWPLILGTVLAFLVLTELSAAQEPGPSAAPPEKAKEIAPPPSLAELGPMAARLRERLAAWEKSMQGVFDASEAQQTLAARQEQLDGLAARLQTLRDSRSYGYDQLADLKSSIRTESELLEEEVTEPLAEALARLEAVRSEWSAERERWERWEVSLPEDVPREAVEPTFAQARRIIELALSRMSEAVKPLLQVQRETTPMLTRIQELTAEVDALLRAVRDELLRKSAPAMFAPAYYSQFRGELWTQVRNGVSAVRWPDRTFFGAQGWLAVLQVGLSLAVTAGIVRHRKLLEGSERWRFLCLRPISAGLFIGVSALSPLYGPVPPTWRLILWAAAGLAAARLLAALITRPWKRRILYLLAVLFLTAQLLRVFGLPLPLFRLYVALVALGGLPLCLWRAAVNARRGDAPVYTWALRLGAVVFGVAFVSQVGGYNALATHLLESSIKTTFIVLLAWMLALLSRGGVEFALGASSPLRGLPLVRRNARAIARRAGFWIDVVVGALALGLVLVIWRFFDTPMDALEGLMGFGVTVGEQRINAGLVITAGVILYGAFLTSWAIQDVFMEEVYPRRHMEWGVRISMNRLIHYALVLLGFFLALGYLGMELRNLTILAGALGVGIGFGLQNIVNNFVSGLILLFERPIKVGDMVELGGQWGTIKKLGLRATVVRTLDGSEVIVPNSDLISTSVTNWTLSDRFSRIVILVGIAYGSDVPLAMKILQEVAESNALVAKDPAPQVYFMEFGDSSLNFEVRVWITDIDRRFQVRSEIHAEIDRRFRDAGVEIAFPQRDLHLRTVDERAERALADVVRTVPAVGGTEDSGEKANPARG